jgi:hypothetical protein
MLVIKLLWREALAVITAVAVPIGKVVLATAATLDY